MRAVCFLLALVLLAGCRDEVVLPESGPTQFVVMDTPRGTAMFVPPFLEDRRDHLLLAMDQVDETLLWSTHPNWAVRVVLPGRKPRIDGDLLELVVGWRDPGHKPLEDMLPGIELLVDSLKHR